MAANSMLFNGETPCLVAGESFFCVDDKVSFECLSGSGYPGSAGSYFGAGKLWVTNLRLIFVPSRPSPAFHSFCIPFLALYDAKIDVPLLFGDTTIVGKCTPLAGLRGPGSLTLAFPTKDAGQSLWEVRL